MKKNINDNINFLRDFVERRQTYIRFSPLGTFIIGIMYVIYYFFGKQITEFFGLGNDILLFLAIGIFGLFFVTILSILNSKRRGEQLLPKSIRYIIVNLIFFGITTLTILFPLIISLGINIQNNFLNYIIVSVLLISYGLLIIVSRFCIPSYIKYFGIACFFTGILLFPLTVFYTYHIEGILNFFYNEIILLFFGIGHLIMAYLLKNTNYKNG